MVFLALIFIAYLDLFLLKIAKQLARERMIEYEKHLYEADLKSTNFNESFSK